MKLRHRLYVVWLTYQRRVEDGLLAVNLIAIPVFLFLHWIGAVSSLPFGSPNECGSGPYKWPC